MTCENKESALSQSRRNRSLYRADKKKEASVRIEFLQGLRSAESHRPTGSREPVSKHSKSRIVQDCVTTGGSLRASVQRACTRLVCAEFVGVFLSMYACACKHM